MKICITGVDFKPTHLYINVFYMCKKSIHCMLYKVTVSDVIWCYAQKSEKRALHVYVFSERRYGSMKKIFISALQNLKCATIEKEK